MSAVELILSLGIGGGIAVILTLWVTGKLVPQLIKTFREELQKEREAHLKAVELIADELKEIRRDIVGTLVDAKIRRRTG